MEIRSWHPRQESTKEEEYLLKRLKRNKKLFAFLRENRPELLDEEFQAELELMYRDTGGCGSSGTKAKMFRERAEGGASGWRMGEEPGECWEVDLRRAWCD